MVASGAFSVALAWMRAGKSGSEAYLADWKRSEPRRCGDDLQAEAAAEAARIEARYSDADLLRLIRSHGLEDPPQPAAPPAAGGAA